MTSDGRDTDRAAVYASELAAFDGTDLETIVGVDNLVRRSRRVLEGEWWPGPAVVVRAARSDARSSSTRCDTDGAVVRLAAGQATVATAAHELAHALAGADQGHGATFRRSMLDVVEVITNSDSSDRRGTLHVDQLDAAFAAAGLPVAERSWPAPDAGGAIAL